MFILDASTLIYAFRRDLPLHVPCYAWLTSALARSKVELALSRVTTLPSLGEAAAGVGDVLAFLQALKKASYRRLEPGEGHDTHFQRLCNELGLKGNDVNDAYLAALALEHGATLVSTDKALPALVDSVGLIRRGEGERVLRERWR